MQQPIDKVLSRLDNVRQRQNGQWSARCPAHDDKSPSLSVAEADDGTLLIKCFAGCTFSEIFSSLDLDPGEAFPSKQKPVKTPKRSPRLITASQALEILDSEANIVAICANNLYRNVALTDQDRDRLNTSAGRIAWLREEAGIKPRKLDSGET